MRQDRLKSLSLAFINRDIELEPDSILDIFAIQHSRRLQFVNIFS